MDLVKHTLRILPRQSDCVDHEWIGHDLFQARKERADHLRHRGSIQMTAQRQMKMEILKYEWISPVQHLLVLSGRQLCLPAAGSIGIRQGCAKRIKRFDSRCGATS
jgi:hypothetical protein